MSNNAAFQSCHRDKLADLYVMKELAERLQGSRVTVNAVAPGYFINTTIHRQRNDIFVLCARMIFGIGTLFNLNTLEKGARTHVWLAPSAEVSTQSDKYFECCTEKTVSGFANDVTLRKKLWAWSEEVSGVVCSY